MAMKRLRLNTKGCSCQDILRLADRSGFCIFEGAKHYKIKTSKDEFIAMVPRHNPLNTFTAKGIAERMNLFGASIDIY
jgi:hypothetical protein